MKSAHEEKLVDLVKASLDRNPIDDLQLLGCFSEDNKFIAALVLGHIATQSNQLAEQSLQLAEQKKKTDEILQIVTDLSTNAKDNKISIVNVSKLFILYPHLLERYDYDLSIQSITYDGVALKPDSPELTYLSIELEQYFGSKDIYHGDLLKAIKRYFLRLHKEDHDLEHEVESICREYLSGSKTKPRTRIPLKHLRANIQLPLAEIKSLMETNGYVEWKDKNNSVHFYKLEN